MRLLKIIAPLLFSSFLFISLCFTLFSCSNNNPVTSVGADTTLDSSRYYWRIYSTFKNGSPDKGEYRRNTIWIRDTNDIIINGYLHYDRGSISNIPGDFSFNVLSVGGFGKDFGYLIGSTYSSDRVIKIKKWNGNTFNDLPVINDSIIGNTAYSVFENPSKIWIATDTCYIYKFDGTGLTKYLLPFTDSINCKLEKLYIDSASKKLTAIIWTNKDHGFEDKFNKYSIYSLNNAWDKLGEFELSIFHTPEIDAPNGYLITITSNSVSLFNGNSFTEIAKANGFDFFDLFEMSSSHDILVWGGIPIAPYQNDNGVFNWNGVKWSRELRTTNTIGSTFAINSSTYLFMNWEYIAIGTKK